MPLYPLKFKPRYLEKMWGGRKIEQILAKRLPPEKPIGESWEVYDFPPGVVDNSAGWISCELSNGPLAGKTLHQLVGEFGRKLHGDVPLVGPQGQFPILIKFLDAQQDLSLQVHPDKAYAAAHPSAHLKNEAWYIVQANEGSRLLKGVKDRVTKQSFNAAIAAGSVDSLVHAVPVAEGDCYYLPSGTVHALGAGILAAEVQTPSDTTFRVFDFNRVDPATGKKRALHVEQALQCIHFGRADELPPMSADGEIFPKTSPLVRCESFYFSKTRLTQGDMRAIAYGQPAVWMMLKGSASLTVRGEGVATVVHAGETVLLPADMEHPWVEAKADCVWLEITFPIGR